MRVVTPPSKRHAHLPHHRDHPAPTLLCMAQVYSYKVYSETGFLTCHPVCALYAHATRTCMCMCMSTARTLGAHYIHHVFIGHPLCKSLVALTLTLTLTLTHIPNP